LNLEAVRRPTGQRYPTGGRAADSGAPGWKLEGDVHRREVRPRGQRDRARRGVEGCRRRGTETRSDVEAFAAARTAVGRSRSVGTASVRRADGGNRRGGHRAGRATAEDTGLSTGARGVDSAVGFGLRGTLAEIFERNPELARAAAGDRRDSVAFDSRRARLERHRAHRHRSHRPRGLHLEPRREQEGSAADITVDVKERRSLLLHVEGDVVDVLGDRQVGLEDDVERPRRRCRGLVLPASREEGSAEDGAGEWDHEPHANWLHEVFRPFPNRVGRDDPMNRRLVP
jgi:hypothetical protein